MDEIELLKQQAQMNRSQYESNASDPNVDESVATKYLGYDPQLKLAKLQDINGNVFYGKSDTNGAIARGEDVRLRRGYGLPGYDAMPHVSPELPTEKQTTKTAITTDLLYYLDTQKDEDIAPNISGEWTFSGGRCRPVTSYYGGVERYASQEECILNNSIVSDAYIAYAGASGYDWSFTTEYDYTGVNINLSNPAHNLIEWIILVFYIDTYSSFPSTLTINCDISVSGGVDYTEWVIGKEVEYLYYPNPQVIENHYYLSRTPNLGSSFTTNVNLRKASDIGNGSSYVGDGVSRTAIGILLSFRRAFGDSPYRSAYASGRIEVTWNPLPEKVPVGDFYFRRQQNAQIKDVHLGEIGLTNGLQCFLSQAPKKTFVSFFQYDEYDENEIAQYRFLQKFIVEGVEATAILYENPEIPVEDSDWLQPVYSYELSLLTPENIRAALGLAGLCLQLPLYIQTFNLHKSVFYKIDLYEEQAGTQVQELLRTQPVTVQAKIISISLDTENNACSLTKETPKTIKLLPIGDEKARIVSASFLIVKKYARS
ncbi:hypothetical protein [Nostoc sp. DedQUE07]|uniref:hypothetical protein n=1 Tax=Nostoc sp. DedQUE07 TaxID=3075392 RepID=UPI002AD2A713|nr:hypothetical protein [Nostoc sp. DedQUE07]MDZ8131858.1 hypothetical protein [Nostoc sp. DedQUE07]